MLCFVVFGFLHYWPFVRGIHLWQVDSHHKGPVMQSFDFFLCSIRQQIRDVQSLFTYTKWAYPQSKDAITTHRYSTNQELYTGFVLCCVLLWLGWKSFYPYPSGLFCWLPECQSWWWYDIDGLVKERRNSCALAMELRLSCTNPLIWKSFLHYWPFVRGIHLSQVVSTHKGPTMWNFDVFCVITLNKLLNNSRVAGDLRCNDASVMSPHILYWLPQCKWMTAVSRTPFIAFIDICQSVLFTFTFMKYSMAAKS